VREDCDDARVDEVQQIEAGEGEDERAEHGGALAEPPPS
jgi:hypothetical protein